MSRLTTLYKAWLEARDTIDFTHLSSEEFKEQTREKCTEDPCGSTLVKKASVRHLLPNDLPYFNYFIKDKEKSGWMLKQLGKLFGWYIVIEAEKLCLK